MPRHMRGQHAPKVSPTHPTPAPVVTTPVESTEEPTIVEDAVKVVRGPGRPPGVGNLEYDTVDATLTKCQKCGSTERQKYRKDPVIHRQPFSDKTVITTWRKTRCLKCNRARRDKYVTEEPSETTPTQAATPSSDVN
jgi:hypothetical protein